VLPTSSPIEALEHAAKKKPDLIISDLRMPDMDGLELLDRVRSISPQTRVILLTAYGDWELLQDVVKRGGEAMLLKPSSNEEILRSVHKALKEMERCSR
jgi:two-component system response regulator YesN